MSWSSSRARPLKEFGDVLSPRAASEPILAGPVRGAVLGWLREIQAADELSAVGVEPRTTCLLFGPPGCGKTTLAHHLAARLGVEMLVVRADMLLSKYLGDFTKNIAGVFDACEAHEQRLLVFFDEIDAIGGDRGSFSGGGADNERHSGLNVLLQKIEHFRNGWLIAATNRQDGLDDALWRRFRMQIDVALPGEAERAAILKRYLSPFDVADAELMELAERTSGASPALLKEFAEGIKRSLVLFPKMGWPAGQRAVLDSVLGAVKPHPTYDTPELWRSRGDLPFTAWPLTRAEPA